MEANEKTMTVKDVLTDIHKMLGDINVPASKIQDIGIPIARAMDGIRACLNAMPGDEQKVVPETEKEDSSIEIVQEASEERND